jgi:hypothetical protein
MECARRGSNAQPTAPNADDERRASRWLASPSSYPPTNPPTIFSAWTASQSGQGSPWVTTTDGTNNAIVWVVGAQGNHRLHGYDGDTGDVVYAGGGANELMTGDRKWNSGIVARGSIHVSNDNKAYKFNVPGGALTPTPTVTPTPTSTPKPPPITDSKSVSYSDTNGSAYTYCYSRCNLYSYLDCDSNSPCYSDN